MENKILLSQSSNAAKKWMVKFPSGKVVHFGAYGYEDYTIHKDKERKDRYDQRHYRKENWEKSGIKTAGFWAKWLLWNQTTISKSITDIENRFNVKISKVVSF